MVRLPFRFQSRPTSRLSDKLLFTDLTGMSKIWSVASALARMLTLPEGQWAWDEALPRSFELTTARLERARDGLREAREKAGPAADRWVPNEGGPGFRASSMA
jgi:hypothetical protein